MGLQTCLAQTRASTDPLSYLFLQSPGLPHYKGICEWEDD